MTIKQIALYISIHLQMSSSIYKLNPHSHCATTHPMQVLPLHVLLLLHVRVDRLHLHYKLRVLTRLQKMDNDQIALPRLETF